MQPVSDDIVTEIRDHFELKPENDAEMNSYDDTVIIPSLTQMKDVTKTNGLLYRGFNDYKLLHHFEKEDMVIL